MDRNWWNTQIGTICGRLPPIPAHIARRYLPSCQKAVTLQSKSNPTGV
ncbi:MAG: hypothetical protein J1F40_10155 [Prevotellaceae bacterium]|nr:hypothetical protein [Prevotellaceae bacterium]